MKKLINDPHHVVREMLEGFVALTPSHALLADENVILRADIPPLQQRAERNEVAIISGGGSGHEPAHAGYVGKGMLHAAVAGEIFTSPSTDAIVAAIRAAAGPMGALLIVKNYTGDRLNFGLAAELAKAEGIPVELVIVGDDVALANNSEPNSSANRRGLAGTLFVHKIAGAAAASGESLAAIAKEAREVAQTIGTMGVGLSACSIPGTGKPSFELADNEIELGLGIHGEPGVKKCALQPANVLVDQLLTQIIETKHFKKDEHVALLINNLGGTSTQELGILANRAVHFLNQRGMVIDRAWSGTFLTALEMAGFSLSLMRVTHSLLERLDAPTEAPAWPRSLEAQQVSGRYPRIISDQSFYSAPTCSYTTMTDLTQMRRLISAAALALEEAEPKLTELDRITGDGDMGLSLARGAQAMLSVLSRNAPPQHPSALFTDLSNAVRRSIGGTSGPIYAVFLLSIGQRLARVSQEISILDWGEALQEGCRAITALGGAQIGDRTLLDALQPAIDTFIQSITQGNSIKTASTTALEVARSGAQKTATLMPRLGRSSYLGERVLGTPDPGAIAVTVWLHALYTAYWPEEKIPQ